MEWKRVCAVIVTYFAYLLLGALAFHAIERPLELERCVRAMKFNEEFRQNYTVTNLTFTYKEIVNLFELVSQFRGHGIRFEGRNVTCTKNWDYEGAIFFSGTIVTTIGYGNVFPTTNSSRVLAVFYALIGIPLFALLYSALGEKIGQFVRQLAAHVHRWTEGSAVAMKTFSMTHKSHLLDLHRHGFDLVSSVRAENAIIFFTFGTIGFIFMCCIPSVIFMYVEGWSFGIGLYYSIISLTTIGFGDFVAGSNPNIHYVTVYKVMVYVWILIGLAFMAVFLSIISDRIKQHGKNASDEGSPTSRVTPIVDVLPGGAQDKSCKKEAAEENQLDEIKET